MNANAETVEPTLQQQLADVYAVRAEKRHERVTLNTRAEVASASVAAAEADLQRQTDEKAAMLARRSEQIERWWASGHSGSPPSVVPDLAGETKLLTAANTVQASSAALK